MLKLFKKAPLYSLVIVLALVLAFNTAQATEITFWSGETEEERQAVIRDIVEEFEEEYPEIEVEIVPVHESDLPDQLTAAMAADTLPALVELGLEHVMLLSELDLLDSETAELAIENIGRDDYFSSPIEMTSIEGENLAVPMHGWVQAIWYRQDWFDEAGIDSPEDWETIEEAAEYFNDPPETYGFITGTGATHYTRQGFNQFAFSNEAYMFDEEGNIAFDSPEMVETMEFYKSLDEYAPPGPQDHRDARSLYIADQLGMLVYSTFFMGTLDEGAPELIEDTGFAPRMVNEEEAVYGQFQSLGVTDTASEEEKEAARKLIEFMMTDDQYIDYLHMAPAGMLPVRGSVAEDPNYRDHELLEVFGEQLDDIIDSLEVADGFGFEHDQIHPELGPITAQFVIGSEIAEMLDQDRSPEEVVRRINEWMEDIVE